MPGEANDLEWGGGKIGDYQISKDYATPPKAKSTDYLTRDDAQSEVNSHLKNNPKALAKLYGIKESEVTAFLAKPAPTKAREAFRDAFEAKMAQKKGPGDAPGASHSTNLEEFLEDPKLLKLYKAAVKEEVNSKDYKNAVFLNSVHHYPGETTENPFYIPAGGPSGAGKSFLKHPIVNAAIDTLPKKRDEQGNVVNDGNTVVSVDNGIARSNLQVGNMLLQHAFSKGYKIIDDFNEKTKASAKSKIKAAATEVGMNIYKPKTYVKPKAYQTVLKWLKKHDGYHKGRKYDLVAANIEVNKEVVRNQGVKRAELREAFSPDSIALNNKNMPAESKRYGRLVGDLDQRFRKLKNRSFQSGNTNSKNAATVFQQKGIPVIRVDSTSRILVAFNQDGNLERTRDDENESAFIIDTKVLQEWKKANKEGGTKEDVMAFAKTVPTDSPIIVSDSMREMQALRETYVKFYQAHNSPDTVLLPISDFNELLRVGKLQSNSNEAKSNRQKLMGMLSSTLGENVDEAKKNSTISKFLNTKFTVKPKRGSLKRYLKNTFNKIFNISAKKSWKKHAKKTLKMTLRRSSEGGVRRRSDASAQNMLSLSKDKIEDLIMMSGEAKTPFSYEGLSSELEKTAPEGLIDKLKKIDKSILDSKSALLHVQGKEVRVYDGDAEFKLEINGFYARGLEHAVAFLTIADLESPEVDIDKEAFKKALAKYTQEMESLGDTPEDFEKAHDSTVGFVQMMSVELANAREDKSEDKAFKDIKKATELLSGIDPKEDAVCTISTNDKGEKTVQLSERSRFSGEPLEAVKEKAWYKQNQAKHGTWFERFMKNRGADVLKTSPVCTTRDMPNPSNAWAEQSFVLDKDGNILHQENYTRFAISSPFDIKDKKARVDMAAQNMEMLLNEQTLQKLKDDYMAKWGPLLDPNESVTIPIMHQTLVAPTFFYGPDRNMMEVKRKSNKQVHSYLEENQKKENGHEINFELGQVNNCINVWHPLIIPTNQDVRDSNRLVGLTADMLERANKKAPNDDLKVTLEYLNNSRRPLLPPLIGRFGPSAKEQIAIESVRKQLWDGTLFDNNDIPSDRQKDLSIMMQSAVHLKRINQESQGGYILRQIKNSIRIKQIPVLAPIVGLVMSPLYLARYAVNVTKRLYGHLRDKAPSELVEVFMPSRNQQTAKSVYESLISNQLGMVMGGCKSAFDRAGEVNIHKQAMLNQMYANDGKLLDSTSSEVAYNDYLKEYVDPLEKAGHQNHVVASTDKIGGRKLAEARTHSYIAASSEDKAKAKQATELRKVTSSLKGEAKAAKLRAYQSVMHPSQPEEAGVVFEVDLREPLMGHQPGQGSNNPEQSASVVELEPAVPASVGGIDRLNAILASPRLPSGAPVGPSVANPSSIAITYPEGGVPHAAVSVPTPVSTPTPAAMLPAANPASARAIQDVDLFSVAEPPAQEEAAQADVQEQAAPQAGAEELSLETIKGLLEANSRKVSNDLRHPDRLSVSRVNLSAPSYPEPHYTLAINEPTRGSMLYRIPPDKDGKLDPKAIQLACEDAVKLAKPGAVFDLSKTPPAMFEEVRVELSRAMQKAGREDLIIGKTPDDVRPSPSSTPRA